MEKGHVIILRDFLNQLEKESIKSILDAGSGKTSLSTLFSYYSDSIIDAVVYPGDLRKINSIRDAIFGKYSLIERNLCADNITTYYDLVISHLLLGEAMKFGNSFRRLFDKLMNIPCRYLIIIDYLEDLSVDYKAIDDYINAHNFELIKKMSVENDNPQKFQGLIGKTNIGYLINCKPI